MHVLVAGATGAIGQCIVRECVANAGITRVTTATRRDATHLFEKDEKLRHKVVNFDDLPDDLFDGVSVLYIAVGTTQKAAGSNEAFYAVDHELVLNLCKKAHIANVKHVSLVSSLGANVHSRNFYLRTKGQIEEDIKELHFDRFSIFRPSVLDDADRLEKRWGESFALCCLNYICYPCFNVCCPGYSSIKVSIVARCMVRESLMEGTGVQLYDGSQVINKLYDHLLTHAYDISTSPTLASSSSPKTDRKPSKEEEEHKEKEPDVHTTDDETDRIIRAMHDSLDADEDQSKAIIRSSSVSSDQSASSPKSSSSPRTCDAHDKDKKRTSCDDSDHPTVTSSLAESSKLATTEIIDLTDVQLKRTASVLASRRESTTSEDLDATLADLEKEEKQLEAMLEEEKKLSDAALAEQNGTNTILDPAVKLSPRTDSVSLERSASVSSTTSVASDASTKSTSKNKKKNKKKKK